MESLIFVIGAMALMLILGFVIADAGYTSAYNAGWEDGVQDVIEALPMDCVRFLAEEAIKDPGMQMQMMVDIERESIERRR